MFLLGRSFDLGTVSRKEERRLLNEGIHQGLRADKIQERSI
jgi:hypothetical protein